MKNIVFIFLCSFSSISFADSLECASIPAEFATIGGANDVIRLDVDSSQKGQSPAQLNVVSERRHDAMVITSINKPNVSAIVFVDKYDANKGYIASFTERKEIYLRPFLITENGLEISDVVVSAKGNVQVEDLGGTNMMKCSIKGLLSPLTSLFGQ